MTAESNKLLAKFGRLVSTSDAKAVRDIGKQFMRSGGGSEIFGQAIVSGAIDALTGKKEELLPICPRCGQRHA